MTEMCGFTVRETEREREKKAGATIADSSYEIEVKNKTCSPTREEILAKDVCVCVCSCQGIYIGMGWQINRREEESRNGRRGGAGAGGRFIQS